MAVLHLFFNHPTLAQQKAFIVDDRLAALRRAPALKSEVVRRLRIGRPVYIVETRPAKGEQPKFYRVAVSRRTRGWLHAGALIIVGRAGEELRLMNLVDLSDGFDRLRLCRFFLEHFPRSPLAPRLLLTVAEEAERVASTLNRSADRRLKNLREASGYQMRDYYLSDTGLDRYSRLGIHFEFVESRKAYAYDGQAYLEIIKRYPKSAEAEMARKHLAAVKERLAQK
jgi:hypothetical protein